ncbi:hypothetical protein [Thermococcus stetteri]|uniref:hypothetical protein n=1 Tax=Thermococcus stetteri TaxID=49900 RepID=UPI001AE9E47F|nr:hypothetical protein [Thermococcus stetteri]MBP1910903.1 hypothetical protein [Thermococcus stetteri]
MEVINLLRKKSSTRIEFVRDLVAFMLSTDLGNSNEVLFRDAVDEVYSILREEVVERGKKELADAYEKAVLLRFVVFNEEMDPKKLLSDILESTR